MYYDIHPNSLVRLKQRSRFAYHGYIVQDSPEHSKIGIVVKSGLVNTTQVGYWVDILWDDGKIDSQLTSSLELIK